MLSDAARRHCILADLNHTKGDALIESTFNSVFQLQDSNSKVKLLVGRHLVINTTMFITYVH